MIFVHCADIMVDHLTVNFVILYWWSASQFYYPQLLLFSINATGGYRITQNRFNVLIDVLYCVHLIC